jgi:hypothetical protein
VAASEHTCVRPHTPGFMVIVMMFVLFVRFLTRDLSVVLIVRIKYILEVSQSGPPRLAPYQWVILTRLKGEKGLTA